MTDEPLGALLEGLQTGDLEAVEQAFLAYEPYLRMAVRRQMPRQVQAKFDSGDIVQSVWAGLLQGFRNDRWHFASTAQLRAFLLTVTRNRLSDRLRQHHRALEREQPLASLGPDGLPSGQPRPSEIAQAGDLWDKMLALCPPDHHEVLRLRRQGLQLNEIAHRTGLHEGSVRRILRRLARQLAFDQEPLPDAPGDE
jgi:RNA polymerase sigma-70 factor (ECF subfamily)